MGASESRKAAAAVHARIPPAMRGIKTAENITWNEFAACVREINERCKSLKNERDEYFGFGVKKETMDGFERWKDTVEVACVAIDSSTLGYKYLKTLKLRSFLNVYYAFRFTSILGKKEVDPVKGESLPSTSRVDPLEAVAAPRGAAHLSDEENCCLCFDRPLDTILPCTHAFCGVCILQWSEYRPQFLCPLCKAPIEQPLSDGWEITERPEEQEVITYFEQLTK